MRMLDQAWWRRRGVDALRMLSLVLNRGEALSRVIKGLVF
jgi:hypothetical protein